MEHPQPSVSASDARLCWILIGIGAVVGLVICYFVTQRAFWLGNGEAGWVYRYPVEFDPKALRVFLTVATVALPWLALRPSGARRDWLLVVLWLTVSFAVQILLRPLAPETFQDIFASDASNGYYSVTRQYSASTVLARFDDVRATFPAHLNFNMPGKLLLVYALENFSRQPGVIAWLVVAVSNLGGVSYYLFARELFRDARVALYSLVFFLFTPGRLFFLPVLNAVTPVIVMSCLYLLLRTLRSRSPVYPLLMGAGLYALVLYEPLPLVLGLLFAALALAAIERGEITFVRALRQLGFTIAGFALVYAAVFAATSFDLFSTFRLVWIDGQAFNRQTGRPYWYWVGENLIDFAFGVGFVQVAAFSAALWLGLARTDGSGRRLTQPIAVLTLGLLATVLVTDLIGMHRGESTREWIFFACIFQIPVAYLCAALNRRLAIVMVVAVTLLHVTLGTSMIGFVLTD